MRLRHPTNIQDVSLLTYASWKVYVVAAIYVSFYGISGQMWVTTAGQPYEWALQEQKRIVREKADENKEKGVSFESGTTEKKEAELNIDYESLPSPIMPSAWSCAMIFFTVTSHILFHLMCHWSIRFRTLFLYQAARQIRRGSFIRVDPHANKGKAAICLIEESDVSLRLRFIFQYQTYEFIEEEEACEGLLGDICDPGLQLVASPTDLSWQDYKNSRGLETEGALEKAQDRYGPNTFELPRPTFIDLYKTQLMSPVAMFQFASAALFMLDRYWKYTCFTLMSILGFEASTSFQRLKSMNTLRGMSTKSYNVYVYRKLKWDEVAIDDLLPGDIVSLTAKNSEEKTEGATEENKKDAAANKNLTVPCDCLVLKGNAIVNEATLTGESVPQMKDALGTPDDPKSQVDLFGRQRIHTLFSGTSLIQASLGQKAIQDDSSSNHGVPDPPNDGIVCFVLRTGFNSSQGELMRMIEFSTEEVSSDKLETAAQLLFLLTFALVAAGYVLHKGLQDPTRPTYKTLLRCTLIITQVVPPQLPMQMAFAVHTALMTLLKAGIFCTEPFRVPFAGRIEYCFFDKTGTLTSDQMVAVGIVNGDDKKPGEAAQADALLKDKKTDDAGMKKGFLTQHAHGEPKAHVLFKDASTYAAMCVAGCHSLIEVDGKAIGDPIEVAALAGVQWSYTPSDNTASPGPWRSKELFLAKQKEYLDRLRDDIEADKKEKEELSKKRAELETELKKDRLEAKKLQCVIEQRFHFSSELQRMSTICRVTTTGGGDKLPPSGLYCLTKGSPEAIARLLSSKPTWYDVTYQRLAEKVTASLH
jgi:cation-transporting ATPase 13A1